MPLYEVTSITERRDARTWQQNEKLGRTLVRSWDVETDSPKVGSVAVVTAWQEETEILIGTTYSYGNPGDPEATPSPIPADPWFEEDTGVFANNIQCDPTGDEGRSWRITVTYGPPADGEPKPANPLQEAESIDYGGETWERIIDQDVDGNAIVNTAGDPFDPPLTVEDYRPTFTVTRNEPVYNPLSADPYKGFNPAAEYDLRGTLNDDVFYGFPIGTVKFGIPTARLLWSQDAPGTHYYWQVTRPYYVNPNGWGRVVLNAGRRKLVSGNRKPIFIDGVPAADPVPLDVDGAPIAPGGTPYYKVFEVHPEADFTYWNFSGA